jgi:AcrR family transcriptional regulator
LLPASNIRERMIVSERLHRTQEERTALSERLLVEAAIELLVQRGLAGYSRGLVTHRFGSKAGLLAHVHDTVARHWIERVQGEVGAAIGLLALEKVVQALYGFIAEAPDEIRAMYLLRYASIDPAAEYRANVARVHRAQRQDVQRWIEAGQTAGEITSKVEAALAAELFCATADGLVYRWLVNPTLPMKALHAQLRSGIRESLNQARFPRIRTNSR